MQQQPEAPQTAQQPQASTTGAFRPQQDDDDPGGGKVTVGKWVIALVVTNLLAILGPASTFVAWKATIETQTKYDREQSARELSQIRSALTDGLAAVERRLDRSESLQTEVVTLRAQRAEDRERMADALARIHALESNFPPRAARRYRDEQ